jgi:hypothetical protein
MPPLFAARPKADKEHMINRAACVHYRPLVHVRCKYGIRAPGEPVWQVFGGERNQTILYAFGQAAVALACR